MLRDVRRAMDMNRRDEALLRDIDADTLDLDDIILSVLTEAVRQAEGEAPARLLEPNITFADAAVNLHPDGKGWLLLPRDFMRLVVFRMSDWARAVYSAVDETSPLYLRQSSRLRGIRGSFDRPVVAVVNRGEGKVLEFYSSKDDKAEIVQAAYRPVPRIDKDGGIEVSENCYKGAVYRAAGLALSGMGDETAAQIIELSRTFLT